MRLVKKLESYVFEGKDVKTWGLYLEINNVLIPIKPVYKSDKNVLKVFAENEDNHKEER